MHIARTVACGTSMALLATLGTVRLLAPLLSPSHNHRPLNCYNADFSIGSHRGKSGITIDLDGAEQHQRPSVDACRTALQELYTHGIHRIIDIDVVSHEGSLLVAHPAEIHHDSNISIAPSPCSLLSLHTFLDLLEKVYDTATPYYVTIEPKAAWKGTEESRLAPPQQIVRRVLDTLAQASQQTTGEDSPWCGIILSPDQLQQLREEHGIQASDILAYCQLVLPVRRSESALWQTTASSSVYAMTVPTLELFRGTSETAEKNREVLREQQQQQDATKTMVWIVDTREDLLAALSLPGISGVVSNYPVMMRHMYRELCGNEVEVSKQA